MRYSFTIGQFQPYHKDHERLLNLMIENSDKSWVGVFYPSGGDLFTYEEIKEMMGVCRLNIEIFPVKKNLNLFGKKIPSGFAGRRELLEYVPTDAVFWSGDYSDVFIATLGGFKTHKIDRGTDISGTTLRRMIHQNDGWREYVNQVATRIIEEKYCPANPVSTYL